MFLSNGKASSEIYTLSLHDALPIYELAGVGNANATGSLDTDYTATVRCRNHGGQIVDVKSQVTTAPVTTGRSEEHTSELQSQSNLVCRLLLEKKNNSEFDVCEKVEV